MDAENDVNMKQAKVDDLMAQLAAAEQDLVDAKINLSNLKEQEMSLPGLIAALQ